MPTPETLERFIRHVESNDHVGALRDFYHPHATMQENQQPARAGLDAHMANEARVLAKAQAVSSTCVRPVAVNGDTVAIRWVFAFTWLDGSVTRMEEIAWQRWKGERIAEETFFYDPAQRAPKR